MAAVTLPRNAGASSAHRTVSLRGGILTLDVSPSSAPDWPLERLCDFASRRNPRRGFLVVSKVLGRHLPVRPSEMRAAVRALAGRLPADLPEPILVVGLAETAVGLGQSLFAELLGQGRSACFLPSTRQRVGQPLLCRFEEPHSHASSHLIYRPTAIDWQGARSLLLVDDEVSTGRTLANLAGALGNQLPALERVTIATLTDWASGSGWLAEMPWPAQCVSLLEGALRWEPGSDAAEKGDYGGFDTAAPALGELRAGGPFGRMGTEVKAGFAMPSEAALALPDGARLRVVGTGEFTYPPFLWAERLEQAGHDVVVQATSRSPIHLGGPIRHALSFRDNYGSGAPNYLYNADEPRVTLVCHETPPGSIDPALLDALRARPVYFEGH